MNAHVQTIEGSQARLLPQSVQVCVLIYLQSLTCARLGSVEAFTKMVIRRQGTRFQGRQTLTSKIDGCSYLPCRDGIKAHWSSGRQRWVVATWHSIEQLRPDAEAQL